MRDFHSRGNRVATWYSPGLWSRSLNFGPRVQLQTSKIFGSGSRTIRSIKNHCLYNSLAPQTICLLNGNSKFKLRLNHSKFFGSGSSHPSAWAQAPQSRYSLPCGSMPSCRHTYVQRVLLKETVCFGYYC